MDRMGCKRAKATIVVATAVLMLAVSGCSSPYVGMSSGLSLPTNTTQQDKIETRNAAQWGGSLVAGNHVAPWLDAEIEMKGTRADLHGLNDNGLEESVDGDVQALATMGNLWFKVPGKVSPYAGGGLGLGIERTDMSHSSVSKTAIHETKAAFNWQLGTGVQVDMTDNLTLDFGIRHYEGDRIQQNEARLGFTYSW